MSGKSSHHLPHLEKLFLSAPAFSFKKGQVVIAQNETPSGAYWIEKGYIATRSVNKEGRSKLFLIMKPGEMFPVLWLLRNELKNVSFDAITNITVRKVSKEVLGQYIHENSDAELEIRWILAEYFSIFTNRIDTLQISKAYPRIISYLLFLNHRFGIQDGNSAVIPVPLTHRDIADAVALSRETSSRELSRLEKKGLINLRSENVIIPNRKLLERELEEHYESVLL